MEATEAHRAEPVRDECTINEALWTIEAHDDQPIADGRKHAADLRVVLLLNGERVREFTCPSCGCGARAWVKGAELTSDDIDFLADFDAMHADCEAS